MLTQKPLGVKVAQSCLTVDQKVVLGASSLWLVGSSLRVEPEVELEGVRLHKLARMATHHLELLELLELEGELSAACAIDAVLDGDLHDLVVDVLLQPVQLGLPLVLDLVARQDVLLELLELRSEL